MISLARSLALRQEVEALFADDGEASSLHEDFEDQLHRNFGAAGQANRSVVVTPPKPCEKKVAPAPKPPRPCAVCGVPTSKFARRCRPHAEEHRLAMMGMRTKRLYAARRAAGLCVMCGKQLGFETGRWRHEACQARTRGEKR
jgi:hypothetical protein